MYCSKCGSNNREGATFCDNCGASLNVNMVQAPVTEKKDDTGKIILIILGVLGGLTLVGIIIFVVLPLFFSATWSSVSKSINDQWSNISSYENNSSSSSDVTLDAKEKGKVVVYFFRGEGCSHCAEAEEWFDSLEDEYGDLFIVKDYEVWYSTSNNNFMKRVAESRGEEAQGVPYIIIGNKSWNGFAYSYKSEMLSEIKRVYELH